MPDIPDHPIETKEECGLYQENGTCFHCYAVEESLCPLQDNGVPIGRFLVQNRELHDDVLHRPLFPVHTHFLRNNNAYHDVIAKIVSYMVLVFKQKYANYDKLQGLSGANVGIPYNIVIITKKSHPDGYIVMLNPTIIDKSRDTTYVESNCGSLNLPEKIKVKRYKEVTVRYVQWPGEDNPDYEIATAFEEKVEIFKGGTVQHEIDHNQGILITDRALEGKKHD